MIIKNLARWTFDWMLGEMQKTRSRERRTESHSIERLFKTGMEGNRRQGLCICLRALFSGLALYSLCCILVREEGPANTVKMIYNKIFGRLEWSRKHLWRLSWQCMCMWQGSQWTQFNFNYSFKIWYIDVDICREGIW